MPAIGARVFSSIRKPSFAANRTARFLADLAVRKGDGTIHLEEHDLPHTAARDHAFLRWPIVRGVWGCYETIRLAMQAFSISANDRASASRITGTTSPFPPPTATPTS